MPTLPPPTSPVSDPAHGVAPRAEGEPITETRRAHVRAPIELRVEYKRLNMFFADYTKNISRGGTFIKTKKPLDVGTEFLFKLAITGLPEPLALRGRVKWVVREGEPVPDGVPVGHDPGMGIGFLYANEAERREVERIVEKLMADSLGPVLSSQLLRREHE
jgi:type IV pilus assembly protein PilZ